MKIFSKENVLEAARARIRRIFKEFERITVSFSGGKDSTVVLALALEEATRLNRLPLDVIWVDQEHEWEDTVRYAERLAVDPRVRFHWFQIPFFMTNNANSKGKRIELWSKNSSRSRHPSAITEVPFDPKKVGGMLVFKEMFPLIADWLWGAPSCTLAGVRCDESPSRLMAMTRASYKDMAWGVLQGKGRLATSHCFWPIYDWGISDVWKYIFSQSLDYCQVYDKMYAAGWPVREMRVSNLQHEMATPNIKKIQEVCAQTWDRVGSRVEGAHTLNHMTDAAIAAPKNLPWMFESWVEYRDYLAEKLLDDEAKKKILALFASYPLDKFEIRFHRRLLRAQIRSVLLGDTLGAALSQFNSTVNGASIKIKPNKGVV
jgi:predicted phosphoadenosine phosphosulfate sulfurtransferase